jgi:hypothetical protein
LFLQELEDGAVEGQVAGMVQVFQCKAADLFHIAGVLLFCSTLPGLHEGVLRPAFAFSKSGLYVKIK